jgi:hypothetical protein
VGRILTGSIYDQPMICDQPCIDGTTEDATHGHIRSMAFDEARNLLWTVDGVTLRRIDIISQRDILEEMNNVPYLTSFPPGVLPICVSYVPLNGTVKAVASFSASEYGMSKHWRVSMGIHRSTGDVFVTFGLGHVARYSSKSGSITANIITLSTEHWYRISPIDVHGKFLLYGGGNSMIYWDPNTTGWSTPRLRGGIEARSVRSIAVDPRANLIYSLNIHWTMHPFTCTPSYHVTDGDSTDPILVTGNPCRFPTEGHTLFVFGNGSLYAMTHDRMIPMDHKQPEYTWKKENPSVPELDNKLRLDIGVATGECNGDYVVFYSTRDASCIEYIILPKNADQTKRRRVDVSC